VERLSDAQWAIGMQALGEKSALNYILNDFILRFSRVVCGVLQQPVRKLLAAVGVAGKTLFFWIPQHAGRTGDFRVAFHSSSWIGQAPKLIYHL